MYRFLHLIAAATGFWLAQPGLAQPGLAQPGLAQSAYTIALPLSEEAVLIKAAIAMPTGAEQPKPNEFIANAQWLLVLGLLLIGGAISWGVFQYSRQQKWRHIEFLRQAIREFEQDQEIHNALKILDFEEYRDYQLSQPASARSSFHVTDDLLCQALASHDQRALVKQRIDEDQANGSLDPAVLRTYQIETTLRDWFNKMLNGLEHFGYFIESGFFSAKELEPWLSYWIKLIADPVYRRPGSSKVYDALYSYIHHSGFLGVQKLFERFGYRILPSPYQDSDLLTLSLALKSPVPASRSSFSQRASRLAPQLASPLSPPVSPSPSPAFNASVALTLAKAAYLSYQDKAFIAEVVDRWGCTLQQHASPSAQKKKLANPKAVTQEAVTQKAITQEAITQKAITQKTMGSDSLLPQAADSFVQHNFRYFNNRGRDTQAYLFRTDTFMVLAFRGSKEPKDWLTNVTTQLCSFTLRKDGISTLSSYKGKVHTGFFLAWASIEDDVLAQISSWRSEQTQQDTKLPPLYITGHSLGGALATMAAAALSDYGVDVAGVYTFGQPRVGDRTFVNQLNAHTRGKVFRFVNNNDIVPHVPPPFSIRNPTRLYGHVGTVEYFNASGNITTHNQILGRLLDSSWGLLKGAVGAQLDLISDHKMEYYISHLDRALKEAAEDKAAQMLTVGDPVPDLLASCSVSSVSTSQSLQS
ncbi:MAG: lipase family protein [Phormidesmis sp.]